MRICSCCSVAQSWPTVCNPIDCSMPGFLVLYYLLEFAQTYLHRGDDAIWTSPPVIPFSSCPQSFPAWVFSSELALHIRWPKYWSFSFSISPSSEYSGLISFRIDWFDLLGVSWKAKFFSVQPSLWYNSHSHRWLLKKPYLWLNGPLSAKWCLWFFNTLSRFVIAYHPRNKHLNFMAAVTVCSNFGAQENKVCCSFHFLPFYVPHNCTHLTH